MQSLGCVKCRNGINSLVFSSFWCVKKVMAWMLCLMWITLAVPYQPASAASNWGQQYNGQGNGYVQQQPFQSTYNVFYFYNQGYEWGNHNPVPSYAPLPQRVNERSISLSSPIQKVQEDQKRLFDDKVTRIENGSYRIVNDFIKPRQETENRRGNNGSTSVESRGGVVFPEQTSHGAFRPQIPSDCKKIGICENVPNYPDAHANRIIQEVGASSGKFNVDQLLPTITMRYGEPDEIELCTYNEKIISPQAAPDRDGKWHFIVNNKDTPVQAFRVEICTGEASCNDNLGYSFTYKSKCKQKYMLRNMAILDDNGNLVQSPLIIPSCCSCVLTLSESEDKK